MEAEKSKAWIMGIIKSCNNSFHFEGADKLIEFYHTKYKLSGPYMELLQARTEQWNLIHQILV